MKVLHVINTLSAGGAERHLLLLSRLLHQHGIEVVVACLKDETRGSRSLRQDFEAAGVRVVDLRGARALSVGCVIRFAQLVWCEKPAVLHTHLPRADFLGLVAKALRPSLPWVCSVHGIYETHWSGRRLMPLFKAVWRQADVIIAISGAVKAWLAETCRAREKSLRVVWYGIDPSEFNRSPLPQAVRRNTRGWRIGSIGRLEPVKGHEALIRAMVDVVKEDPDALLRIAGHDPTGYRETLNALIAQLGLAGVVELTGFVSDVPSFLRSLDVFAFASKSEGFGQVVLEAMASGVPVVASNIPPLTEIIVNGETGILADQGDPSAFAAAILFLLRSCEERQRIARQSEEWVRTKFSAACMVEKTLAIYREVTSR